MALKDFKFENLPLSQRFMIVGGSGAVLLALAYVFLFSALLEQRTGLKSEIEDLETKVTEANLVMAQLAKFRAEERQLQARLSQLRSILPSQKETPTVLRNIQEMAAASNLKIMKFTPQVTVPKAFYSDWPIIVEVEGSYDGLGFFFERISDYTRIINVENLAVTGLTGSKDSQKTLKATCTATTFVYREETPTPAPSKPGTPSAAK